VQKLRDRWEHDRLPPLSRWAEWAQWAQWPQFETRQLEFDGFGHPGLDDGEGRGLLQLFVRVSSFFGLEI